jgi:cold shock CspA family protein
MAFGRIKELFVNQGRGTIQQENGQQLFFTLHDLQNWGDLCYYTPGQVVEFDLEPGTEGLRAVRIRLPSWVYPRH